MAMRRKKTVKVGVEKAGKGKSAPSDDVERSPSQNLIDRFCALESLPKPLSDELQQEWLQILSEMRVSHAHDRLIQNFVREKARCVNREAELRAFQSKLERKCSHCDAVIAKDELAFFDLKGRKVHCIQCDFILLRS